MNATQQHNGFTLNATKDPRKRVMKLIDGVQHIDGEIKTLKDRKRLMMHELAENVMLLELDE